MVEWNRRLQIQQNIIAIKNPLVIGVGTGYYKDESIKDLPVNLDLTHLQRFCNYFRYTLHQKVMDRSGRGE